MVHGSGSLNTSAPGWTVTDSDPPSNVTSWLLPGTTAAPSACRPTYTESKVTGRSPKALEREMRTPEPPMLVCTRLRTVWSARPVTAATRSALAPQVTIGWVAGLDLVGAAVGNA